MFPLPSGFIHASPLMAFFHGQHVVVWSENRWWNGSIKGNLKPFEQLMNVIDGGDHPKKTWYSFIRSVGSLLVPIHYLGYAQLYDRNVSICYVGIKVEDHAAATHGIEMVGTISKFVSVFGSWWRRRGRSICVDVWEKRQIKKSRSRMHKQMERWKDGAIREVPFLDHKITAEDGDIASTYGPGRAL